MTEPVNNQWLDNQLLKLYHSYNGADGYHMPVSEAKQAILSKLESIEQEAYKKGYEACFNQRHMRQLYEAKPTVIKEELLHE